MQQLPTTRTCGACRGCCLPWAVPEVGKLDAAWCPKSTPGDGCTIYATRPDACKKFACVWLNGKGEESDRPDVLGVMMDFEDVRLGSKTVCVFHLWELEKNAMDKQRVRQIARANESAGNIVILHRPRDAKSYISTVRLSNAHFSKAEIAEFQLTYRR